MDLGAKFILFFCEEADSDDIQELFKGAEEVESFEDLLANYTILTEVLKYAFQLPDISCYRLDLRSIWLWTTSPRSYTNSKPEPCVPAS